ncbi:MAG: N-acetylornithine carbamoyltransferase [bacterium]|nr:N-acetylornithine carbamoyltransferase [bacterium]
MSLTEIKPATTPKHFLNTQDWSWDELSSLIDHAIELKSSPIQPLLKGKSIALVFFNPSLRTRASFDIGANQLGAHAVVLEPGSGAWEMAFNEGEVMDGPAEEHAKEAARVLSRYCDIIAVRAFPKFQDWSIDRQDRVLNAFATHATVPVINMETITHPCQELAHLMALREHFATSDLRGKKYVLTWTYHPKPLNTAVANSAAMIATRAGMDVTMLCPNEHYLLDERYMNTAANNAKETGGSFQVTHDIDSAYKDADIVYAKSWGAIPYFGNWDAEKPIRDQYKHFIVDEAKMATTNNAAFSHCLPARRNVKATDAVMDSPNSLIIEEAENRLHAQKALMAAIAGTNH